MNAKPSENPVVCTLESHEDHHVVFGESCTFRMLHLPEGTSYAVYVAFESIHYPEPVQEWTETSTFTFRPQALGTYALSVKVRNGSEQQLLPPIRFLVERKDGVPQHHRPTVRQGEPFERWASNRWEMDFYERHEKKIMESVLMMIQPGWVIYDIGANIGLHAMRFLEKTGSEGHVVCFEPNPLLIYFLNLNFASNQIRNASIIPLAAADEEKSLEFSFNPGNSFIGKGMNSCLPHSSSGIQIGVRSIRVDHAVETFNLPAPDLVKLDIEGAEGEALIGMTHLLEEHQPILILEVHGLRAATQSFSILDRFGYRYIEALSKREFTDTEELLQQLSEGITMFLCLPGKV